MVNYKVEIEPKDFFTIQDSAKELSESLASIAKKIKPKDRMKNGCLILCAHLAKSIYESLNEINNEQDEKIGCSR